MLDALTNKFLPIVKSLRGQGRLTEANMREAAANIRAALLEADVPPQLADDFLQKTMDEAAGQRLEAAVNPGRVFLAVVHRRLAELMGGGNAPLRLGRAPAVVLACGLQGVGKTTNLAKIAKRLKTNDKKRVLLASVDVRRKAALAQLQTLADAAGVPCFESDEEEDAIRRAKAALGQARRQLADVLLVDTAGRTVLDEELMNEIAALRDVLQPTETLFFVDAMQGQDAINTARAFNNRVGVSGLALTKFDGDSRGGAALSARAVTGAPIKFVGVGEKPDDLQPFYPDRFASRILGQGDIASLAEELQNKGDAAALRGAAKLHQKPNSFDLNDQLAQVRQMKKMGGMANVLDKLPGNMAKKLDEMGAGDGRAIVRMEAIILSMTPQERRRPELIKASRKRRIAAGAAVAVPQVNQLLQQHDVAKKMMKRHAKNPLALMRMMGQMFG